MASKKRKRKPLPPQYERASRKLTIRVTPTDYDMLEELRLALTLGTDGQAVRALIRLNHEHFSKTALAKARTQLETRETNKKQLRLFGGTR